MAQHNNSKPHLLDPDEEQALLDAVIWPSHEPLAYMRRRGGTPKAYAGQYEAYHKPENIKRWARLLGPSGMIRLHFFKGMGLKAEREEINKTIAAAKVMHQEGLKVSLYVGGTMHTDWFYQEVPSARDWACVSNDGSPITYMGYQLWRHFPCINNPEYRQYLFKVLDVGIDEADADQFFFDNQILRAEPRSCRCKVCLKLFPEYVARKYTEQERIERFGYANVTGITPPLWSEAWPPALLHEISDPVIQDWIDFRCHTVYDFFLAVKGHIQGKKPATSVGINVKGLHPHNICYNNGIDHGRWLATGANSLDAGLHAHVGKQGNALAEFRSFKITHTSGLTQGNMDNNLDDLLTLVMNKTDDVPGLGEWPIMGREINFVYGALGRFLRQNEKDLYGRRPIFTEVGVLRSFPSMAYNTKNWCYGPFIVEQGLWEARIPFGILFDQNMDDLSQYRVLVLANQESLSDRNVERLKRFVEAGGGLVATEKTGTYDDWRRRRSRNALAEAFGLAEKIPVKVKGIAYRGYGGTFPLDQKPQRIQFGKGRVVYLPEIKPKFPYKGDPLRHQHGKHEDAFPPANWKQLEEALRWASGGIFQFEVKAPRGVVAEFRQGPTSRDRVVHLVNLNAKPARGAVRVSMRVEPGEKWTLELRSPDVLPKKLPALKETKGRVTFGLPGVGLYTACVLRPKD